MRKGSFSMALRERANMASMTSSACVQRVADSVSFPSYLPCGWVTNRSFHGWIPPGMRGAPEAVKSSLVESSSKSELARNIGRAGPGLVTFPRTA